MNHLSIRTCTFSFNFLLRSPESKWQRNIEIIARRFGSCAAAPHLPEVIFPQIEFVSAVGESCCFIRETSPGIEPQYISASVNVLAPHFDSSRFIFCFVLRRALHANGSSQCRHRQAPVARFVFPFRGTAETGKEKNKDLSDLLSEVYKKRSAERKRI